MYGKSKMNVGNFDPMTVLIIILYETTKNKAPVSFANY